MIGLLLLVGGVSTTQAQAPSRKKATKKPAQPAAPAQMMVSRAVRINFSGEPVPVEHQAVSRNLASALQRNVSYQQYLMRFRRRAVEEYFPVFEQYLKRYGIPLDFKYLAVVESGLQADALSPKGAMGYWQLMPEPARELGLKVTEAVDERKDLHKSTDAACRYLRSLYRNLRSWTMVAAAYNGGIGRMQSHMRKQGETNYYFLSMNQETSQYLYKIVAVKELFNNPGYFKAGAVENIYERERAEAVARGILPPDEPELIGEPLDETVARAEESSSMGKLLGELNKPAPSVATAPAAGRYRGDVRAELVRAGKPVLGQTWQFKVLEDAELGEQKLAKDELLLAVVDEMDPRTGQIYLRVTKRLVDGKPQPIPLTLVSQHPRTGLSGVPLPKTIAPGWLVGWKAF